MLLFHYKNMTERLKIELEDQFTVVESKYKDIRTHTVVKLF